MRYTNNSRRRRIFADENFDDDMDMDLPAEEGSGDVSVDPEATDLLFEAEDVADLVAEVTGDSVEVSVAEDGDTVTFEVGDEEYIVEAEGDEEVLESVRTGRSRRARRVTSSRRRPLSSRVDRRVAASRRVTSSRRKSPLASSRRRRTSR